MILTDREFIAQFEAKALHPQYFNHRGHLRLGWLYLTAYPLDEAITKTCSGIRDYATHLGAKNKFHTTLTVAAVQIVHERMMGSTVTSFDEFLEHNRDLMDDLPQLIDQHYSRELLFSEMARERYIEPDLQPFVVLERE